jgi:hypothetical protein
MAIKRCPYCRAIIDEKDQYCNNCGTQLLFPEDADAEEEIKGEKIVDADVEDKDYEIPKPEDQASGTAESAEEEELEEDEAEPEEEVILVDENKPDEGGKKSTASRRKRPRRRRSPVCLPGGMPFRRFPRNPPQRFLRKEFPSYSRPKGAGAEVRPKREERRNSKTNR